MKRVFEYLGICHHELKINGDCKFCRLNRPETPAKDGNLMVEAINKMQEKGELGVFKRFTFDEHRTQYPQADNFVDFEFWLFGDPANFFKLMEEAIKEKVIGKTLFYHSSETGTRHG